MWVKHVDTDQREVLQRECRKTGMTGASLVRCVCGIAKLLTEVEAVGSRRCSQCLREVAKLPTEVVEATGSRSGIQSTYTYTEKS